MIVMLFWEDKNWHKRGYANNVWLKVNTVNREYERTVTYSVPPVTDNRILTVTRKSDIDGFVEHLRSMGYHDRKEVI